MVRSGKKAEAPRIGRTAASGKFRTRGETPAGGESASRTVREAAAQQLAVADAYLAFAREAHGASVQTLSLILAAQLGLMEGGMRHINARVPARLLERATERAGAEAVTEVVTRALAGLATRSEIGPWLAEHWGALKDVDPAIAAELDAL